MMTRIETERLVLSSPMPEDGPDAVRYLDDLETARKMTRIPHPYSLEDWHWFMENIVRGKTEDVLALRDRQDGRFMGVISFQLGRDEPVLGYWLGAPFRGQGVMKEAGVAFLRYGFAAHGVKSFISGHFEDNPASGRVLSYLGFEEFTRDIETSLARGDEKVMHVTMRLTRTRFEALHPEG